jgi:N-acetyl-anhydromuramyl-L-alanine amidase AmpD
MMMRITRIGCAPENFRKGRPSHLQIEAVVIHLIDGSQADADATSLSTALALKRSAHYSVSRTGEIHKYVDEQDTAFHCGIVHEPTWPGLKRGPDGQLINPNFYTIGIEHEGRVDDPWPDAMYAASAALLRDIATRYSALTPITRRNVIMHREIRADKTCPGHMADITRLILEAGGPAVEEPQALRTRSTVNVRRGQPSTSAPIVRVIPAGELVNVRTHVTGEALNGISVWYQNMDDDYIWGGAVTILQT